MQIYENLSLNNLEGEIWKPLFGYEKTHLASSLGRLKKLAYTSKDRIGKDLPKAEKIIKGTKHPKGYVKTRLYVSPENFLPHQVHRLICRTFHGPAPAGMDQVNHLNGIKWDNRAINLEWSNNSLNITHAWANGLHKPKLPSGINCGRATLLVHTEYGYFCTIIEAARDAGTTRERMGRMVRNVIPNITKYIIA